tara:strand:+ start:99 stop:593 length:495 start_codon:yes stop_codon:yes gene_type:complete
MKEIYKDIPNYEGMYQVSSSGVVKSLKRKGVLNDRILKLSVNSRGYLKCSLHKDGKLKTSKVHQLVAMAFLNHKPNWYEMVVDHINNIKTDNNVENLQVITHRENTSKDRTGTSKYTGVYWSKSKSKWRCEIQINGRKKNLGTFRCEIKAHLAYQKALKELILV